MRPGSSRRTCPVQALGLTFPHPLGLAAASTRTPSASTGSPPSASATSRSAPSRGRRSPATRSRGCSGSRPTGRSSTGWASTTTAPRSWRGAPARPPGAAGGGLDVLGVNIGKTKVVPEERGGPRLREVGRAARAPTPTTSSSTSPRPTRPACATCRPSRSSSRCSPPYAVAPTRRSPDRRVPLLVKIAPDLSDDDVLAVADLALATGLDGIIATNTTISRDGLASPAAARRGDRRGRPQRTAADAAVGGRRTPPARAGRSRPHPGRASAASPPSTTRAGASRPGADLLQGYTAFVYEGPLWPRRIVRGLATDA